MKKLWFGSLFALFLFLGLANADVWSDNNLSAYFTFDNLSSENTFENLVNANYNISSISNPLVSDGINSNAINCQGTNASYSVRTPYAITDEYTLSFWVYPNNTEDNPTQSWVSDWYAGGTRGWIGFITSNDLIYSEPNPTTPLHTNYTILSNNWLYVTLTSKPNEHRAYVNGNLVGVSSSSAGRPTNVNGTFAVCGIPEDNAIFFGAIDEVAFFDKAINESAVQEIYNAGAGNFPFEEEPPAEEPEQTSYLNQPTYQVMEGSGAGLGMFLEYLAQSLPLLMIGLVIVGIISVIGYALAGVIKKAIAP